MLVVVGFKMKREIIAPAALCVTHGHGRGRVVVWHELGPSYPRR